MAAFGIPDAAIDAEIGKETAGDQCEIHADNELTALCFFALNTQWRLVPGLDFRRQGIEYASIPLVLARFQVPARQRPELIAELQVMERAALAVWDPEQADDAAA